MKKLKYFVFVSIACTLSYFSVPSQVVALSFDIPGNGNTYKAPATDISNIDPGMLIHGNAGIDPNMLIPGKVGIDPGIMLELTYRK